MEDEGYWGPVTSAVDWCEDNYRVTVYVAEFFNTLSSLPMVLLAAYALLLSARRQHTRSTLFYNIACVLTMAVGAGSMAFHGTLTHAGQVLDEVPMLWCICSFILVLVVVHPEPCFRAIPNRNIVVPAAVFAWASAATAVYLYSGFVVFVIMFFFSVIATIVLGYRRAMRAASPRHRVLARWLTAVAGASYLVASFVFWIPEMLFCGNRLQSDHPSVFQHLHAHAIFHLLAGASLYAFLSYAAIIQLESEGRKGDFLWNPAPVIVVVAA
ncbi:putative alkaline ceramidase dcd3B [Diplonema papillatum]|nr:putative alkaline ceramidase dcd3B [Diplonema papillatum]|eukprot:gene17249-26481_t